MNWKFTAGLVVVCLGLGVFAYFDSKKDAPLPDSHEIRLWDLRKDASINQVTFTDSQGHHAEYIKTDKAWHYAPNATASLQSFNWDNPYSNLANLIVDRKLNSVGNLKEFGLDKPRLTIALGDASHPHLYTLQVGGKNALDGSTYYIQINHQKAVYTMTDWKVQDWQRLAVNPPIATPSPVPSPLPSPSAAPKHAAKPTSPKKPSSPTR